MGKGYGKGDGVGLYMRDSVGWGGGGKWNEFCLYFITISLYLFVNDDCLYVKI